MYKETNIKHIGYSLYANAYTHIYITPFECNQITTLMPKWHVFEMPDNGDNELLFETNEYLANQIHKQYTAFGGYRWLVFKIYDDLEMPKISTELMEYSRL